MSLSDKQIGILEDFGYEVNEIDDDQGKGILDALAENKWKPLPNGPTPKPENERKRKALSPDGPATAKQKEVLERHDCSTNVTFAEASAMIDELKANGWKKPDTL